MRIVILLSGRFPTEKAYGVTTNGTIRALVAMGHSVTVYGLESDYKEINLNYSKVELRNYKELSFMRLFKLIAYSGKGVLSKVCWNIFWKSVYYSNREELRRAKFEVAWIRDPKMYKFVIDMPKNIVEIHNFVGRKGILKLTNNCENGNLVLAPISRTLTNYVASLNLKSKVVMAPMGIDLDQISAENSINDFVLQIQNSRKMKRQSIKVGYVGKFLPNGYSKGIEDLLDLACLNKLEKLELEISLVGGTLEEVANFEKKRSNLNLNPSDLEITPHLPHREALERMKTFEVLVLPQPDSKKYFGFPLKCIEAVASGRILVVADCSIYRDIFVSHFQPYWYTPKSPKSLFCAITNALSDNRLAEKILLGLEFARGFTWNQRTRTILNYLE